MSMAACLPLCHQDGLYKIAIAVLPGLSPAFYNVDLYRHQYALSAHAGVPEIPRIADREHQL